MQNLRGGVPPNLAVERNHTPMEYFQNYYCSFKNSFISSFLAVLVFTATRAFSGCGGGACAGFARGGSQAREGKLSILVHGLGSVACGIVPDQGSNLCFLHWQAVFTTEPPGEPFLTIILKNLLSLLLAAWVFVCCVWILVEGSRGYSLVAGSRFLITLALLLWSRAIGCGLSSCGTRV